MKKRPSVALPDARARLPEFMSLLERLVEAESPSRDALRNRRCAQLLEDQLKSVGARVRRFPSQGFGDHLLASFRMRGSERPPLLFIGHMDTVHPVGVLDSLPRRREGDKMFGPGIYDMKSGLAATIQAFRALREKGGRPSGDVEFLITCDEEIGSPTSRALVEERARAARAALVIEPPIPGGGLKSRRKGVATYELEVRGRSAHAGIEPEKGASAVHEIAQLAVEARRIQDAACTVNVGVIRGGERSNVVADRASCSIDVRFWSSEAGEKADKRMRALRTSDERCALTLRGGINRGPLERTPESARLIRQAQAIAAYIGFELGEGSTGGASDGNFASAAGCPALDGLGVDGAGAHTKSEHIFVDDAPRRIALLSGLLECL